MLNYFWDLNSTTWNTKNSSSKIVHELECLGSNSWKYAGLSVNQLNVIEMLYKCLRIELNTNWKSVIYIFFVTQSKQLSSIIFALEPYFKLLVQNKTAGSKVPNEIK